MGLYRFAAMLALGFAVSASSSSAPVENAFLVKIPGELCTGTVIAMDWVLSAAHCFSRRVTSVRRNKHGDVVIEGQQDDYVYRYVD